jgi:hypothetical protein
VGLNGTLAGGTGDNLPDGISSIINTHTGTRSRSSRGWLFMPGPGKSSWIAGNAWSSAYRAQLEAWAAGLSTVISLGGTLPSHLNPVVYSRTRRSRATPPWTFQITSATLGIQPRWLRSRMDTP